MSLKLPIVWLRVRCTVSMFFLFLTPFYIFLIVYLDAFFLDSGLATTCEGYSFVDFFLPSLIGSVDV